MKHTFKAVLVGLGFATMVGCSQVTPNNTQPFTSEAPSGNDLSCPGTNNLNCFIEFPDGNQTFDDLNFNQSYTACMDACLPANCTDGGSDIIDEAADECPSQFASCDEQCNMISEESTLANLPDSDGLALPQNPKAVLVELTGCFDSGVFNEIHVQGPEVHFAAPIEGYRKVFSTGFLGLGGKKTRLGYGVARNPRCPSSLRNRVKVKYIPVGETTVALGSNNITVVPFTNATVVEKERALPSTIGFGLPAAMRDEMDFSEVVSIPKEFGSLSPSSMHAINDWRFYNNDISYGQTVIFAGYYGFATSGVTQTIKFYIFAKARE